MNSFEINKYLGALLGTCLVLMAIHLASGAEYLLVEQDDTYGRDPFESLSMSRDHLLGLGYDALF